MFISREQTTRPPAPFPQLPSPPQSLPQQELNVPFVRAVQSPHFRLIGIALIDLHLLLFHLKASASFSVVTWELLISGPAFTLFSKLYYLLFRRPFPSSVDFYILCCFFFVVVI